LKELIRYFPISEYSPMQIQMSGISYRDSDYHITRIVSDVTVIEYILQGEGFVTVDGKDIPVLKDSVYILKKGEYHNYYSSANDPWQKISINFSGDLPLLLLKEFGIFSEWLFDGTEVKELFLKVAAIAQNPQKHEHDSASLAALFFEIISRLSSVYQRSSHSEEAIRLKKYLDANTDRIVSNAELASHIYRSKDYVLKLFAAEYGTTPYNYQIEHKMDAAKQFLRNTTLSISAIAVAVGYSDQRYFSGLFKRKCGVSPREYRKSTHLT